jgi:hypothetical protein
MMEGEREPKEDRRSNKTEENVNKNIPPRLASSSLLRRGQGLPTPAFRPRVSVYTFGEDRTGRQGRSHEPWAPHTTAPNRHPTDGIFARRVVLRREFYGKVCAIGRWADASFAASMASSSTLWTSIVRSLCLPSRLTVLIICCNETKTSEDNDALKSTEFNSCVLRMKKSCMRATVCLRGSRQRLAGCANSESLLPRPLLGEEGRRELETENGGLKMEAGREPKQDQREKKRIETKTRRSLPASRALPC